ERWICWRHCPIQLISRWGPIARKRAAATDRSCASSWPSAARKLHEKRGGSRPSQTRITGNRSVEQAGNRFFRSRARDRFTDQVRNADDADARRGFYGRSRLDGVSDDQFLERGTHDAGHGAAGKHAMRDIGGYAGCTVCKQGFSSVAQSAAGIDDIIDQQAVAALDVTDDV